MGNESEVEQEITEIMEKYPQAFRKMRGVTSHHLADKRGLILGITNDKSIAYGCAKVFHLLGAEMAVTYRNEKAERFVRPLAEDMGCPIIMPCDVETPGSMETVFERISREWGGLDFVLHSIASAPKDDLHARVTDCSREGFLLAMETSCYSFIQAARLAEPLMQNGGSLLTITYYGSEKVVANYNIMGPVKAALESCVRYMAAELGPKKIRVNSISPGPILTRAASGIEHFDELMERAVAGAPEHHLVTIEDVGSLAGFLVGDRSKSITGDVHYIDGGFHIIG
ncbi:MAG: enoyl-ACP reductase FabI [Syntrophorhabdaceae bacterium]|nr:enoyl-ACP reductase FabI [Syntrophorhabdaceae bacterium]MDD5242895.1 enoyl-ACP reductase FabI [Syntrophorhabdaceae bacterium]